MDEQPELEQTQDETEERRPSRAKPDAEQEEKPRKPFEDLYTWLQTLAVGLSIAVLIFIFLGRPIVVDGHSMDPTLAHGDVMLVRSIGYTPRQGDVVVLTKYFDEVTGPIVKRVIATGGQTVEINYAAGTVTVDGVTLDENYILEPMVQRSWQTIDTITVPEGSIFVMGDNRNVSNDSRNPSLGTVDQRYVLGQVMTVIFPFQDFGPVG